MRFLVALGTVPVASILAMNGPLAQSAATEYRPNLVATQASSLSVVRESGVTNLRFSTMSWNSGTGPLELRAGEINLDQLTRRVYQRVYLSDGGFYDNFAGDFVYHPEHQHFHFEDYALYRLVPVNAPGASERQSAKTTFCVMDTNKIPNFPGPASAVYSTCGSDIQGMSVGWGDTYGAHLFGQSFDVTDSPDGDYDLIIEIDPRLRILESNESDNSACVRVRLNVSSRSVQNLGSCTSPGSVTVTSITPNFGYQGTVTTNVRITGSGLVAGMAVGFENGSGPAPIVSDVQYVDANNITLTVTIKSNGPRRERLWDVRVGPAVLLKGFTVRP
jgi:Lysyl oxidase